MILWVRTSFFFSVWVAKTRILRVTCQWLESKFGRFIICLLLTVWIIILLAEGFKFSIQRLFNNVTQLATWVFRLTVLGSKFVHNSDLRFIFKTYITALGIVKLENIRERFKNKVQFQSHKVALLINTVKTVFTCKFLLHSFQLNSSKIYDHNR